MNIRSLSLAFSCVALMSLPGCKLGDWFKGVKNEAVNEIVEKGKGEVLLTIDGQPEITVPEFEAYYDQILEQQPQLKQFASFMPDLKQNIFSTMASQKVIEHWAKKNKLDQKSDYLADKQAMLDNVDRTLAIKYFQAAHPVNVSDSDVKKFYDDNKDSIYLMAPKGVNALGVSFDKEAAAKEFLAKVEKPGADFAKIAVAAKTTVRNFGRVHETSEVEDALKKKILGMTKFPSTQLIRVDKTYWIVQAKSKEDAKYYAFDQAKEDARNRVTMERTGDIFNKEIEKLKGEFKVVEFKEYFAPKKDDVPAAVQLQETAQTDVEEKSSEVQQA